MSYPSDVVYVTDGQGGIKQDAAVLIAQCRQTEWQYWETKNELRLLSSWLTNHNRWEDIDKLLKEKFPS